MQSEGVKKERRQSDREIRQLSAKTTKDRRTNERTWAYFRDPPTPKFGTLRTRRLGQPDNLRRLLGAGSNVSLEPLETFYSEDHLDRNRNIYRLLIKWPCSSPVYVCGVLTLGAHKASLFVTAQGKRTKKGSQHFQGQVESTEKLCLWRDLVAAVLNIPRWVMD